MATTLGKASAGLFKTALGKIIAGVLVVAVVATGVVVTPIIAKNVQQGHDTPGTQPTTSVHTTEKMPPTETNCPTNGKARPMVSANLARGKSNNLFYFDRTSGETLLKRYDPATRKTNTVLSLQKETASGAQVSGDGQWILFWSSPPAQYASQARSNGAKLQAVRADGQGLQTLYCTNKGIYSSAPAWSPDGKHIAFNYSTMPDTGGSYSGGTYILNTGDGSLYDTYPYQTTQYTGDHVAPLTWIDNTRLAVEHDVDMIASPPPPAGVYLLDTAQKRIYTSLKQLTPVVDEGAAFCWDYTLSLDMQTLYSSDCPAGQGGYAPEGESNIVAHPLNGGAPRTLLSKTAPPVFYATRIVAVTKTSIFFQVTQGASLQEGGIWRINLDGTDLKQAFSTNKGDTVSGASTPWSSISRDAMWISNVNSAYDGTEIQSKLQILSPDNGTISTLITYPDNSYDNTNVVVAGWTQL